jgi:peptidoglycan hydrolase FlgJ
MPSGADGEPSFNLFGVKAGASWAGKAVGSSTLEYVAGAPVSTVERFRAYDSAQTGVSDYVQLLAGSSRYVAALGKGDDVGAFAAALQKGGYATDPRYAQKLTAVASTVGAILDAGLKGGGALPIPNVPRVG